MGPGLITGIVDDDSTGIAGYSIAGAHFGYSLLWTLILAVFALAIVGEMAARIGAITGKGLADVIRERFGVRDHVLSRCSSCWWRTGDHHRRVRRYRGRLRDLRHLTLHHRSPGGAAGLRCRRLGHLSSRGEGATDRSRWSSSLTSSPASWRDRIGAPWRPTPSSALPRHPGLSHRAHRRHRHDDHALAAVLPAVDGRRQGPGGARVQDGAPGRVRRRLRRRLSPSSSS